MQLGFGNIDLSVPGCLVDCDPRVTITQNALHQREQQRSLY